jgi:hypothetical protein
MKSWLMVSVEKSGSAGFSVPPAAILSELGG